MRKLIFIFLLISTPVTLLADSEPYLSFTWEVTDGTGEPVASKDQHYEGSAPITAKMTVKMVYQDATGETRDYDDATFYGGWRRSFSLLGNVLYLLSLLFGAPSFRLHIFR